MNFFNFFKKQKEIILEENENSNFNNNIVIAIDIDNVLNNLCEAVLSVYNEDSEDNLEPSEIKTYYIENYVKEAYKQNFHNYFLSKKVWKRCELIPDCQKYVSKLYNEGYTIIFCTSTEPENLPKKASWLKRNFPYIDTRKALFSCPKKQYLSAATILIDDCAANFGGQEYSIVLDYPWNRSYLTDNHRSFRAFTWEHIYKHVHTITNQIKSYSEKI